MNPTQETPCEPGLVPEASSGQVSPKPFCLVDNREALQKKLLTRRTVGELRDRGIYPKTTVASTLAERQRQLLRAKTGDFLKHKIQSRPNRQELIDHHILEDTSADPSLHDRQRLLKRAKLQDRLNGKLQQRMPSHELLSRNILIPPETSPTHPGIFDDDELASLFASPSPPQLLASPSPPQLFPSPSPPEPIPSPPALELPKPKPNTKSQSSTVSNGTRRNKQKVIKFHEYTGPKTKTANATRSAQRAALAQRNPVFPKTKSVDQREPEPIRLPQSNSVPNLQTISPANIQTNLQTISPANIQPKIVPEDVKKPDENNDKWQDMKVSDLRDECRRQGIPVSGPKPILLKRLRDWMNSQSPPRQQLQKQHSLNASQPIYQRLNSDGAVQFFSRSSNQSTTDISASSIGLGSVKQTSINPAVANNGKQAPTLLATPSTPAVSQTLLPTPSTPAVTQTLMLLPTSSNSNALRVVLPAQVLLSPETTVNTEHPLASDLMPLMLSPETTIKTENPLSPDYMPIIVSSQSTPVINSSVPLHSVLSQSAASSHNQSPLQFPANSIVNQQNNSMLINPVNADQKPPIVQIQHQQPSNQIPSNLHRSLSQQQQQHIDLLNSLSSSALLSSSVPSQSAASGHVTEQTRLVAEQQRQIHELQQKLLESERKLQELQGKDDVIIDQFSQDQVTSISQQQMTPMLGAADTAIQLQYTSDGIPIPPPPPFLDVDAFFKSHDMVTDTPAVVQNENHSLDLLEPQWTTALEIDNSNQTIPANIEMKLDPSVTNTQPATVTDVDSMDVDIMQILDDLPPSASFSPPQTADDSDAMVDFSNFLPSPLFQ